MEVSKDIELNGHQGVDIHHTPGIQPEMDPLSWMFWKKKRYIIVAMAFFGFFNIYSLRVTLTVAIDQMTAPTRIEHYNGSISYAPEFNWDPKQKEFILSAFYYGYIITQFIGDFLGQLMGEHHYVFGAGIFVTSIATMIIPLAARNSFELLFAVRFISGVFEGVTFSCIYSLWSRWAPPMERSRMTSIAFSGIYVGILVAMPMSSLLIEKSGWESVFYLFGIIGVVWVFLWLLIVRGGPEEDSFCSADEARYIHDSIGSKGKQSVKHPLKAMFSSTAVYAIVVAHFCESWGLNLLITQLPRFLRETKALMVVGLSAGSPFFLIAILLVISGYLADWCQIKRFLTTTQVRKFYTCGAFLAQAVLMILIPHLSLHLWLMVCIAIAVGLGAFAWSGFGVNILDIAPQHACILMGISNTFATIPQIVSPYITDAIVQTQDFKQRPDWWPVVYYISAGIYLAGCGIYWIWASGYLQKWAKTPFPPSDDKERMYN